MKNTIAIFSALLMTGIAHQAFASDGTLDFIGNITGITCTAVATNGSTIGTVTLPTVTQSALKGIGNTAGATQFSIKLSDCSTDPKPIKAAAWFESGPEINSAGRLKTTVGGADTNDLSIALYNLNSGTPIAIGQGDGSFGSSGVSFDITNGGATLNYQAKYYAETNNVPAGAVVGKVNYTIQYQ